MLVVLYTLTPGCRHFSIDCHKAKVQTTVLPIIDVKTWWNLTLQMLAPTYRLWEFTHQWVMNSNTSDYWPLFWNQHEWTMLKYVMKDFRPFRYWTLWMSKKHMVTLHYVITVYNDMLNHMDGIMRGLYKKKTQWKEHLYFSVKLACQKRSKYHAEVPPITGVCLIPAHMLDSFRKLWLFSEWNMELNNNPEGRTSYTTQYHERYMNHAENEYWAKHRCFLIIKHGTVLSNNLLSSEMGSRSGQSCYNPYDLSSNDEKYWMRKNVAETMPRWSNIPAHLVTAARPYLNLVTEVP